MEFDLKTIFSIFVSVLMVGSIVGFTAFYQFPDQGTGPDDGQDQLKPPTAIDFTAENVDATIEQLLPSIKIEAETNETDIIALNNSIYSIDGIKHVNGSFVQSPYTSLGTGFVYVADISFDADLNSGYVLQKLESETSLQGIDGYAFALVQLPKIVSMASVDQSLNMSREYEFSENISEAIVGLDAMEGDALKVAVSATFIGDDATNVMAFEAQNITAAPVQMLALIEAPVSSLEERLLFNSEVPYSLFDSASGLEDEILEISEIDDANVFFSESEAIIYISVESEIEEAVFSELELFLNDLNAENVVLENNPLSGEISFGEIASSEFLETKSLIEERLQQNSIDALVKEKTGLLSGQAQLSSPNSKQTGSDLTSLFESKGLEVEIMQLGKVEVEEIFDADSNTSYAVPGNVAQAFLSAGHSVGETVPVELTYVLVRGLIESATAVEK